MQTLVIAIHMALFGMCLTSETPRRQREDVLNQSQALQDTGERDKPGFLQVRSTTRGAPAPPSGCEAAQDKGGALTMFVCPGCIWEVDKFWENSVLKLPLTDADIANQKASTWGPDVWWTDTSSSGQQFYYFLNFQATKSPTSDDPNYKKAGKLSCSKDPSQQHDCAFIRTSPLAPYEKLFLDQDTRERAEARLAIKIQDCGNKLRWYLLKKIVEALLDGLAKDGEVQSKVDLAFSLLSLPLMFVPGVGVPAEGVIATTLAGEFGQRVGDWLSEAGNTQSLVSFALDRQQANIKNALSYAQDQAKAAMAIGDLLINTYDTYTDPIKNTPGKLTNQDLMFFNWKFDTEESAQSHCSNKSIVSLVDDAYETVLQMKKIGYSKHKLGHRTWRSYYGVRPCEPFDAWCYCSWLDGMGVDPKKTFHYEGKIPHNFSKMVTNYANKMVKAGDYYVYIRDVELR